MSMDWLDFLEEALEQDLVGEEVWEEPLPAAEEAQRLKQGEAYAWRLSLDEARRALGPAWDALSFLEEGQGPGGERGLIKAEPERAGDVVLARKDLGVAYHLAVVLDDALQGITHVILPRDNEADIEDVPEEVRERLTFHLVSDLDEVFALALLPAPRPARTPKTPTDETGDAAETLAHAHGE